MVVEVDLVRDLIERRIDEKNLSFAEVSRRMKRNVAYIADFMNKHIPEELPEQSRLSLSQILEVSEESLRGPKTKALLGGQTLLPVVRRRIEGDGTRLDPEDAPEGARLRAQRLSNGEVWRVQTDMVEGKGVMPGDCVVIDLDRTPKVGDVVLALHRDGREQILFRLYQPPFLMGFPHRSDPPDPLLVDHKSTVIRGVMVYRCWNME